MSTRLKIGMLAIALTGFGVLMYFAGQEDLLGRLFHRQPPEEDTVAETPVKKPAVTKPEGFSARPPVKPEPESERVRYTFFDTLNDPEMMSYVNLKGEVVNPASPDPGPIQIEQVPVAPSKPKPVPAKTVESASPPSTSPKKEAVVVAKAPAKPVPEKPVAKKNSPAPEPVPSKPVAKTAESTPKGSALAMLESLAPDRTAPIHQGQFWVQVSSFRERDRAETMREFLKKKGYPAFVEEAQVRGKGIWYRVYLGKFSDRGEAETVSEKARKRHGLHPVVVAAG